MRKNKAGFTLSEVLVVIAIISIIMLIAVPSVMLINRRIDRRLFESKKELILVAAEQYGSENDVLFDLNPNSEIVVYINDLLSYGYIEADEECENYSHGCIINPINDEVMNDTPILVVRKNEIFMAYWDETLETSGNVVHTLLDVVCEKLSGAENGGEDGVDANGSSCQCFKNEDGTISLGNSNQCYFATDDPTNWLYYSEENWRVMGIENIPGEGYYVKMITQTPI